MIGQRLFGWLHEGKMWARCPECQEPVADLEHRYDDGPAWSEGVVVTWPEARYSYCELQPCGHQVGGVDLTVNHPWMEELMRVLAAGGRPAADRVQLSQEILKKFYELPTPSLKEWTR